MKTLIEKGAKIIQSMFSDKEWDADGCKIAGFIIAIWGCVLCSISNEMGVQLALIGGGMIAGKSLRENT